VTRIDPRRRTTAGTISVENRTPTGVAVGRGAVWVAHGLLGSLSRIDPQFNQVTETIDVAGRSNEGSVAVGAGAVWAVYGESTFARIDPASARVTASGFAGAAPAGLVVATGAIWVANSGDATVYRFNPTTFEQGPIRTFNVGRRPSGIAYADGAIWVANAGDDAVTRIDPNSNSTITIRVGDGPTAIAAGAGAVWVANTGDGTISRIDPATNDVVETIEVGSAPAGIAVGEGFVWVAAQAP
jgi:YVTN family beta-propeller protein